jgi:hypothetical protein
LVAGSNSTVGTNVLISHNLPTQDYWYWIGVGALLAYAVLFNALFTLALAFLNRKCGHEILILFFSSIKDALIFKFCFEALRKAQAMIPSDSEESNDAKTDSISNEHVIEGDFSFL